MGEDFLLETKAARKLYHKYVADLPIIDYHCHLPPAQIAEDHRFENMTRVWLAGDHYKWRAMRANGVAERFCTGKASDWEKFKKWAETVPYLLRNPLYHWTHLELSRYFKVTDRLLGPDTAKEIWEQGNALLADPGYSCRGLMKMSNVVLVCTTDDPADSLEHHKVVAADKSFGIQVLPAWRPDRGMAVESPKAFNEWLDRLAARADVDIRDFDSYMKALRSRHDFFHKMGCRLSDHGLDTAYAEDYAQKEIAAIFNTIRGGKALAPDEILKFKSAMLFEFGVMDHEKNWTQQYHFSAQRSNNSRMLAVVGPDTGFDSIGDWDIARPLARMLDRLESVEGLARTILYNLNPCDNEVMATMIGNFQDGSVPGKMQFGSGWWFMDQKDGMEKQMNSLSALGLLSRFVGMLTDSRSFISYPRHEYFRRILCNLLGNDIAKGLIPHDLKMVGRMAQDICYFNAARYFGFRNLPKVKKEQ
ncbi:MAG: glucuronate isomerase [Candidatus Sumerlaeota bacterium]|nr:glucuronate isomerase [Candidatus Sumerlaeota bacterium]